MGAAWAVKKPTEGAALLKYVVTAMRVQAGGQAMEHRAGIVGGFLLRAVDSVSSMWYHTRCCAEIKMRTIYGMLIRLARKESLW